MGGGGPWVVDSDQLEVLVIGDRGDVEGGDVEWGIEGVAGDIGIRGDGVSGIDGEVFNGECRGRRDESAVGIDLHGGVGAVVIVVVFIEGRAVGVECSAWRDIEGGGDVPCSVERDLAAGGGGDSSLVGKRGSSVNGNSRVGSDGDCDSLVDVERVNESVSEVVEDSIGPDLVQGDGLSSGGARIVDSNQLEVLVISD